jgi:Niemann-Pick C1 protein
VIELLAEAVTQSRPADASAHVANPIMTRLSFLVAASTLLLASEASAELLTPKHEAGRCAIRGHCGKKSFFGKELPCLDNGLATTPDDDFAEELEALCGPKWKGSKVCCSPDQVRAFRC